MSKRKFSLTNIVISSIHRQNNSLPFSTALFQDMVITGIRLDEFSLSTILNACMGLSRYWAREENSWVFDEAWHISLPDIVSWNAVIAGCVLHEYHDKALELLGQMKRSGICPNMSTLSSALKACSALGRQIHSSLIKVDVAMDPFVVVGLIDFYCKCGLMNEARIVYALMPSKDLIGLNAMIAGHSQNGDDFESLSLFSKMYKEGMGFNETTLLTVLNSAASSQAIKVSEQVHALSVKSECFNPTFMW
ncbi:hypothetical protein LguiA_025181 [Lonicera macranthoides]